MQRITKLFLVPVFVLGLFSCTSALVPPEPEALVTKSVVEEDATSTPHLNPYSLRVMQAACDSLMNRQSRIFSPDNPEPPLRLEATDYYIRFDITDSTNYAALIEMDMDLFDYPLDVDLPSDFTPDSTWAYAVVKPSELYNRPLDHVITTNSLNGNFSVTQMSDNHNLTCQILDACYIPPDFNIPQNPNDSFKPFALSAEQPTEDDSLPFSSYDLEMMAHKIAGYEMPMGRAISKYYPYGTVTLGCDNSGGTVPLKNTKVHVRSGVKIFDCFTDANGEYRSSVGFLFSPKIQVRLRTTDNTIVCWKANLITPKCHDFGDCPSKTAPKNIYIPFGGEQWKTVAPCSAITEYYIQCRAEGSILPPANMKVLCCEGPGWSSAPMLKRLGNDAALDYLASLEADNSFLEKSILQFLELFLPDIIIGTNWGSYHPYYLTKATVYHELSHASHFATSGNFIWSDYISHIVESWTRSFFRSTYGPGNRYTRGEDICCLGEAWGYANHNLVYKQSEAPYQGPSFHGTSYWFANEIRTFFDLLDQDILTRAEMLQAFSPEIDSIYDYYNRLCSLYPEKRRQITSVFSNYTTLPEQTAFVIHNNSWHNPVFTLRNQDMSEIEELIIPAYHTDTLFSVPFIHAGIDSYITGFPNIAMDYYEGPDCYRTILEVINGQLLYDMPRSVLDEDNWVLSTEIRRRNVKNTYTYEILDEDLF